MNTPIYPGSVLRQGGSTPSQAIKAVQAQLVARGCGPLMQTGLYDDATVAAVSLFQARFTDLRGNPLTVDGIVGPITWASLFGPGTAGDLTDAPNALLRAVLDVARSQIGVMEVPPGSNSGPDVNKYLTSVNCPPGNAWCMAFVYWCFNRACQNLGRSNPVFKTAGVLAGWNNASGRKIKAADAQQNTAFVKPGQLFFISTGGGLGHTGFVERISNGLLTTIEGNTNNGGSREGIGVFRRKARRINSINVGFVEYS